MPECIFCRIVAGSIPCTKLYEDAHVLSFLDIGPISPGHTLLVPKRHYGAIMEMPAGEVAALFKPVAALAAAVKTAVGAEGINVLQNNGPTAGQVVPHLHIHLIPRWPDDGLGFRWPAREADAAVLARQAEAIRVLLKV
ncbi:MAG: HIT family protein [Planctomycetota bacterium]|nr:HIT family protein [Planctomycetota bacterium]